MKNLLFLFLVFLLCSCSSLENNQIASNYSDKNSFTKDLKIGLTPREVRKKLGYPLKIDHAKNIWSFIPVASLLTDESDKMYYYYDDFYCYFSLKKNGEDVLEAVFLTPEK